VKSIRRALLVPLALGLALAIVAAAVGTYLFARVEANALFDVQLQQMAASITGMPLAAPPTALSGGDGDGTLVVQVWNRDGVRVYQSKDEAEAPAQAAPGFATVAGRDGPWRVFSVLAKGQLVQVGQPMRVRNELAAQMALRTTLPLLIAAPLIALLVWFAIRRGLLPLDQLAGAVGRRGEHELASVPTSGWPREVEPLVDALNGLLARLQAALGAQRAFVADAAHALRTPLAAVHLQAQIAERATGETERASALEALKAGLDRATRLSSQLLTLAREEHVDPQRGFAAVDLAAAVRDVVRELAPLAAAKDIDLGVPDSESLTVPADAAALETLLTNLVDNAIRYTPRGGRVDVLTERRDGAPALAVRDNGPGIPIAGRARVFERFVRGAQADIPGSGLGLAIVKRIADRHGATVTLEDGLDGTGLGIVVRFPR